MPNQQMNNGNFDLLTQIYRAANFRQDREASLTIVDETLRAALVTCLGDVREFAVGLTTGDPDNIAVGTTVELAFGDPRMGLGILADDLAGLLQSPRYRVSEPRNYFIIAPKFAKADVPVPENIDRYRKVLSLVETLKKAAAYLDPDSGTLVFVHGGKFELPVNYDVGALAGIDNVALSKILSFVGEDAYSEQKLGILEGAVRGLLEQLSPSDRFSRLLSQLPELATKTIDGYRLFIANFSFDKVRDSLEAAKVEYATKIHKAFSDIQTQILTIPVATVVVATQMKAATSVGYEFWVNLAVLVGCWVFIVLMAFVLFNQFHTLAVLAGEIERQQSQIKKEYRDIAGQFEDVFAFLRRRLCLQRWALGSVGFVLAVGLILAHVVYWQVTDPVRNWVFHSSSTTSVKSPLSLASRPTSAPTAILAPVPSTAIQASGIKP